MTVSFLSRVGRRRLIFFVLATLVAVGAGMLFFLFGARSAEVTVDATISATVLRHQKSGKNVICTDASNCYTFYINSDHDVEYQKSTTGGASWGGTSTQIQAGTFIALAAWYDSWTPGDSGTLVHLAYFTTGNDLIYAVFDTADDTVVASNVVIAAAGAQGTLANGNDVTVTKGTDGDVYMGTVDTTAPTAPASFIHKCASTCTDSANWTSAGSDPWDGTGDDSRGMHSLVLLPLSDTAAHDLGDIMLVSMDVSDSTVEYKIYDDSANAWSADFSDIGTGVDSTTYPHTLSGAVSSTTGDLFISYVHNPGSANTSEVRAFSYSDGWSAMTDPWPDTTDASSVLIDSSIGVDQHRDHLYVAYIRAASSATANDLYVASSTNGGVTWSSEVLVSSGTDRDHRNVSLNAAAFERLYGIWNASGQLYGNSLADIRPVVTASSTGTQASTLDIGTANQYVGGSFALVRDVGTTTVTSITISETGTAHGADDLDDIALYYDLDTTAPYDCASETYGGAEPQYGATDTSGFSGANGTSAFTGAVEVSSSQAMCVYVLLTVKGLATPSDTVEIEIANPSTDIEVESGRSAPAVAVALPGTSSLTGGVLTQAHYHWRFDDGTESLATSATGGVEDTPILGLVRNERLRLRIGVSNKGSSVTDQYRLEYGQMGGSDCSEIVSWVDVGAVGGAWDMSDSPNLTDGADTTNISESVGGISDENTTFETPNAAVKDTASEIASITLSNTEFVELEYSIEALDSAIQSATYCFRVTDAGTPLPDYTVYPRATMRTGNDFFVQRGNVTLSGTSATITAGADYTAPANASSSFIRITNTQMTGAGDDVGGGSQTANNVTVYIVDPENIQSSVTFARFGSSDNTRVAWEIVEYIGPSGGDNEIVVHMASTTRFEAASLTSSVPVSGVSEDADMAVFITAQANPDTGLTDYNTGLVTSDWDDVNDEAELQRGEAVDDALLVSFAAIEFTGSNWRVQRVSHTYAQSVGAETETDFTPVGDVSRAFLHVQKRVGAGLDGMDEFGHEVWLSGVGEISFQLQGSANTPGGHVSVAWLIENVQTTGIPMAVTRSNGTQSSGAEPLTVSVDIGTTLSDLSVASIFSNNRASGVGTTYPRPMMAVELISTSQYQLWISDTGNIRTYRTEVVEWPTAVRTMEQNYYRFYANNDAIDPTDAWPPGAPGLGENTSITSLDTPPTQGDVLRVRMSVTVRGSNLSASTSAFALQFGERSTTCSAISEWWEVGATGSTTALWRGYDATPADGTALSGDPPTVGHLNLSLSDRAGRYVEGGVSTGNPYKVYIGEDIEYDWVLENNIAADQTTYCFRMTESDGTELDGYTFYPTLTTAGYEIATHNWRWYDDESNETPSSALAPENVAPSDLVNENSVKLRITATEIAGKDGENVKLKLQFSEYGDFTREVYDVVESGVCDINSLWCYDDGGGVDGAIVSTGVLTDSDSCTGGAGAGCGTHNESGVSASTFTHTAYAATEFEFTVTHAGARANTVYFFRLYDVTNDLAVAASSSAGAIYPSIATEGAAVTTNFSGIGAGTDVEGVTTDIAVSSSGAAFGALPIGDDVIGAQRFTVSTNATNGYRIFVYERQPLTSSGGSTINPVSSTNAAPAGWGTACTGGAASCWGYHTSEDVLAEGDTTRFTLDDTYAGFSTNPEEVAFSYGPVEDEIVDIVYRIEAREGQEAGLYETNIVYIITTSY